MKKTITIFVISILLLSCGSSAIKTSLLKPISVENVGNKINIEYIAEIGENMAETVYGSYFDAIRIIKGAKSDKYYFDGELKQGETLVKFFDSKDYYIYVCPAMSCQIGVAIAKSNGEAKMYYQNGYSKSVMNFKEPIQFEKTNYLNVSDEYLKQEFVYNGKVGSSIIYV
ncbi:hypothetical protein [Flavobacterium sp.]|uniref:hypothetical protein n=1 Tax=Flavobacterium sp. TaxID=239 RepID=UPI00403404FB